MLLSKDLKRLSDSFDGWSAGRPFPTEEAWLAFRSELRITVAKAALLELGIDGRAFDVAADLAPAPNDAVIVEFPPQRIRRFVLIDGDRA